MNTKMNKGFTLFFLFILSSFNSYSNLCVPEIGAYNMDLEDLTPEGQINFLYSQGLKGIVFEATESTLNKYFESSLVKTGVFNIYSIYVYFNPAEKINSNFYKNIFNRIRNTNTIFQLIVQDKNLPFDQVKDSLLTIATLAKQYNQNITVYPHDHDFIESAEDALKMIQALGQDNVFTAVHLCHELRHGNGHRIEEVVKNVSPYISTISISGASLEELDSSLDWQDAIKPLYMGTYDLTSLYGTLYKYNYTGPVIIHNYGIRKNFELNPAEHLVSSINVITYLAKTICNLNTATYIVPGLIEAEFFNNRTEKASIEESFDIFGRKCISSTQDLGKVNYLVRVKKGGEYIMHFRSFNESAIFEIKVNLGGSLSSMTILPQIGWNNYFGRIYLVEGTYNLELNLKGGKLNWIEFKEAPEGISEFIIYKNPTFDYFLVHLGKEEVIYLYSSTGALIQRITGEGKIHFGQNLGSGLYFVRKENQTVKVVKF